MGDPDQNESNKQRDPLARWIAILGLLVACVSAVAAIFNYSESVQVNARTAKLEAHKLLDSALDHMGGKEGTESFFMPSGPPSEEQRRALEKARRKIERALVLAPDLYVAHEYFGVYLHASGKPREALSYHRRAIELNEDDGWPYSDYANALAEVEQYSEAIEALETALELDPTNPSFYWNLGRVYERQGEIDEAVSQFAKVKALAKSQGKVFPFREVMPTD